MEDPTVSPAAPSQPAINQDPMTPAHHRYREVIEEVGDLWDGMKAAGVTPPWIDPTIEGPLDGDIAARFKAGDREGALRAIERWRHVWINLLTTNSRQEVNREDFVAVESQVLGGEVILFVRNDQAQVPEKYASVVRYTLTELEKMQGLSEDELRALHAAKKALCGRVVVGSALPPDGPPEVVRAVEAAAQRLDGKKLCALANDSRISILHRAVYSNEIDRRLSVPFDGIPMDYSCCKRHRSWGMLGGALVCRACNPKAEPVRGRWNPGVHAMFDRAAVKLCQGHRHWLSTTGVIVCGVCHPPVHLSLVAEWLSEE